MVDLATLNISRTTIATLMNFYFVNTPRNLIFIWVCKVFSLFQQIAACEKSLLFKDRKLHLIRISRCQDIPKHGLRSETMSPTHSIPQYPNSPPPPSPAPLSYSGVIRLKMFALKQWVFLEHIWNFSKWKSLVKDEKYWMLRKAMLGKR